MQDISSKKTNMFAAIALVGTLGLTIAGFVWLHIEPTNNGRPLPKNTGMPLEEKVLLIENKLIQQQIIINELQTKIKQLETFDDQIKAIDKNYR